MKGYAAMHEFMGFIVKPVVRVGKPVASPKSGCCRPEAVSEADYAALRDAAPLTLADLAAIFSGRTPFELEPVDNPAEVEDWARILRRLDRAVERGQLPDTPTLREGVLWALEVGCPMVNQDQLLAAAGLSRHQSRTPQWSGGTRRSEYDPELQAQAERIATELKAERVGRALPKKEIAARLKRRLGLGMDDGTIIRRIRRTW